MKWLLALCLMASIVGCTRDNTVYLPDLAPRVGDLERRADLNDQLDSARDLMIQSNSTAISALDARVSQLEASVSDLESDLAAETAAREAADQAEEAARIAGDAQNDANLQAAVAAQSAVNASLDFRINQLTTKLNQEKAARIAGDTLLALLLGQEAAARAAGDAQNANSLQAAIAAQNAVNNQLSASIAQVQSNLNSETAARQAADAALQALLQGQIAAAQAAQATINSQLNASINSVRNQLNLTTILQGIINAALQAQINHNTSVMNSLASSLSAVQSQVNNMSVSISTLQSQVSSLTSSVSSLSSTVSSHSDSIADLYAQIAALQANQQTFEVYKCNSPSSTENILKIGSRYYGAMNRVVTQNITYLNATGSSQVVKVPAFCRKNDERKFADVDGECSNTWTLESAQNITVPSGSSATIPVVTSVKIAFEALGDGSYVTTDGGPACSFSISNGGTSASNLVLAQ